MKNLNDYIFEGFFKNVGEPELSKLYKLGFTEIEGTKELYKLNIPGFMLKTKARGKIVQSSADYKKDDPDGRNEYDINDSIIYLLPIITYDDRLNIYIQLVDNKNHTWMWNTFSRKIDDPGFAAGEEIYKLRDPKTITHNDWFEYVDDIIVRGVTIPEFSYFNFTGPLANIIDAVLRIDYNKITSE